MPTTVPAASSSPDTAPPVPTPSAEPGTAPGGGSSEDDRARVSVVLTYSGWDAAASRVVVGAYVEDAVETGGTCTLTLTRGDATRTATQAATPDAGSTSCGELAVEASPGTWSARVGYDSPASRGSSGEVEVVVP